ncbi:hypothetical protein [Clostridium sp. HMP27]|uniref:hypothetical protein n=1 Tax=Clostridium sp. HMP27 TaxID=1487921 RepID=UPI00052E1B8D|nr:hypothetical protein [Clostridium sp. HMP27]KGK90120.1 hypothetical protein DP68_01475 [Clostridium sp. HMP27]
MEEYNIPFHQKSSLKWHMKLIFLLLTLFTAGGGIFMLVAVMKEEFIMGLVMGLFMLGIGFYFAYILIAVGILKRFYIEMTEEYIRVSMPFKSKTAYWREIHEAQIYEYNNNTMLAILLEKDVNKKKKRTISNNFTSLYGIPPQSFQIPLRFFSEIDTERLLLTIGEQLNKVYIEDEINIESLNEDNEELDNNIIKAIIAAVLFCVITTSVYGVTIYSLEKNYLMIPIFGCFLIIAGFNKYYLEQSFSLIIRFLMGLICLVQVPAAIILTIIISERAAITGSDILIIINEYFKYLIQNPSDQIVVIIAAIVCFGFGAFRGRVSREQAQE